MMMAPHKIELNYSEQQHVIGALRERAKRYRASAENPENKASERVVALMAADEVDELAARVENA